jgi:hypothetical protein
VSAYLADRRGPGAGRRRCRHWPKLTAVCHTRTHLIAGALVSRGPSQDSPEFPPAMRQAAVTLRPYCVLGEAGCDAEHNPGLCRERPGVRRTVIALNRRNAGRRWPKTRYRRPMRRHFPRRRYGPRWQAESLFSRHTRRLGAALAARRPASQTREALLRVLTHNLWIPKRPQRISTEQKPVETEPSFPSALRPACAVSNLRQGGGGYPHWTPTRLLSMPARSERSFFAGCPGKPPYVSDDRPT